MVVYPSGQRKANIKARLQKCFGGSNPLTTIGNVPERSKGSDLRSLAICFAGSNPAADNQDLQLVVGKTCCFMGKIFQQIRSLPDYLRALADPTFRLITGRSRL